MSAHVAMKSSPTKEIRCRSGGKSLMGETTGDCAAVCCCCPCAVVHLFILALYRLPASIWRRKRKILLLSRKRKKNSSSSLPDKNEDRRQAVADEESRGGCENMQAGENDAENEMWRRFYGGGFWRRDDVDE